MDFRYAGLCCDADGSRTPFMAIIHSGGARGFVAPVASIRGGNAYESVYGFSTRYYLPADDLGSCGTPSLAVIANGLIRPRSSTFINRQNYLDVTVALPESLGGKLWGKCVRNGSATVSAESLLPRLDGEVVKRGIYREAKKMRAYGINDDDFYWPITVDHRPVQVTMPPYTLSQITSWIHGIVAAESSWDGMVSPIMREMAGRGYSVKMLTRRMSGIRITHLDTARDSFVWIPRGIHQDMWDQKLRDMVAGMRLLGSDPHAPLKFSPLYRWTEESVATNHGE